MIRQANQQAGPASNENITVMSVVKGIAVSYAVTVPTFVVFAMILANTDFPEKYLSPVVVITTIISLLLAGSTCTRGLRNKGWLNGSIVGFIYMLILYILSSIIFGNFTIDKYVITMSIIGILTGAIGGIVGINLKSGGRKVRHSR